MPTGLDFWKVYTHLRRPSALPTVSDYHFFREGIRPVWEDEENKMGGKWIMRLKKGVADRYWEDLLLAMIGDQFAEASDEVCGAVLSVRSGEDVLSIWTKNNGGRNIKIRYESDMQRSLGPWLMNAGKPLNECSHCLQTPILSGKVTTIALHNARLLTRHAMTKPATLRPKNDGTRSVKTQGRRRRGLAHHDVGTALPTSISTPFTSCIV